LMVQDLSVGEGTGLVDPESGQRVFNIDLSTRNLWGMRYDSIGGDMIVQGDERNDEVMNLYRLSLEDGSLKKLTDVPYIYGWDFSKDGRTIGYIARHGDAEPYRTCLTLLDLASGESTEVLCQEGGEYRMVWTSVNFTPAGDGVVIRLNKEGHRSLGTLAYVDLANPSLDLLLPDGVERQSVGSYTKGWLDDDSFVYISDETGFSNGYVYDLAARTSRPLTTVTENAWFALLETDEGTKILQVLARPHENVLQVLDLEASEILGELTVDVSLGVMGFDDRDQFVVRQTSASSPFQGDEMKVVMREGRATFEFQPKIRLPEEYLAAIQQCEVERVEFPTFDIDPATGEPRMLHAFLFTPREDRQDPQSRLAVMTSFYGGGNYFSTGTQVFCEAGISWLSPAVRGSSGFGKDFMALNDRDLGGDEIIDLFYGARFLEEKLGLEPQQIGVAGGSHGGYATMRALTFPPETNGRGENYDLGFGMSHAGFSNIVSFYDATNIPDWIILEAGDPETERDRLLDRSPISHVDLLDSPILLTHGSNDNRVGVTESRSFVEAARQLEKPVTYVEFEGQGHGISGLENQVTYYQTRFDFLEDVVCGVEGSRAPECTGSD
ncbi:MAG: prolyl oligopeptidase family serine peptidase, partial [Gemmatimonadetes bacterium]|nr:prolyl oligopeptidase family serine peptidase [Gemmatimonadota bacterium]